MADFDNGDIVRLGCKQRFNSAVDIVNVFHVKINSGGGLAFAAASLDFQQWADTVFASLAAVTSNLQVADSISIKNETKSQVWGSIAFNLYTGGNAATDPVAPQVACLSWGRTAISRVQMRKYWGVFTEVNITGGAWVVGLTSACTFVMSYVIAPQTMTGGLVLQGVAYNEALARATVCLGATSSANPVIQRRRRVGRGS